MERNLRKERDGLVVSDKMDKTVVVSSNSKQLIRFTKRQSPQPRNTKRTTKKTYAA